MTCTYFRIIIHSSVSSHANNMAKLLWEWEPRFAIALVVRGLLIVTSHTNCDVTSCPAVMRRYANADGDEQRYKMSKTQVSLAFRKIVIRCRKRKFPLLFVKL